MLSMVSSELDGRGPEHVVVVDGEADAREAIRDCLVSEGYRVSEVERPAELYRILEHDPPELILLELRFPQEDGLDVLRATLQRTEVPVIIVSSKSDPMDRVIGLELGADDYIVKPFHIREVLARVRTVLRRHQASRPAGEPAARGTWRFDGYTLDTRRRLLTSQEGNRSVLTASEYDLLTILLEHANEPLSRDRIMDLVKGQEWMANDRVIDNRILRLRRKLSSLDGGHDLIQSVRGYGYVLAADVVRH